MRALLLLAVVTGITGCAHVPRWAGGRPRPSPVEELYARALAHLDTTTKAASLDSAIYYLDRYLVSAHRQDHAHEAILLRRLAGEARELHRVEALLQQVRVESERRGEARSGDARSGEAEQRRPGEGDASLREIQRLKDELAKANAELERIRKRLANPREPPG